MDLKFTYDVGTKVDMTRVKHRPGLHASPNFPTSVTSTGLTGSQKLRGFPASPFRLSPNEIQRDSSSGNYGKKLSILKMRSCESPCGQVTELSGPRVWPWHLGEADKLNESA